MGIKDTPSRYLYIRQVIAITVIWTLIGVIDALHIHLLSEGLYLNRTPAYDFSLFISLGAVSYFLSGVVSGWLLVFYLRPWSRKRPFGVSVLLNTTIITVVNLLISALVYHLLISYRVDQSWLGDTVLAKTITLLKSPYYLKNVVLWIIVVLLTIIALNVHEKYGQGVLLKMLRGHYHKPREEERIFLFADLKSSTEIAEKLGHVKFFGLLNDFFADITEPVIRTRGEIYQYVGDEVVISWSMKRGLYHNNCLRCFFLMQEAIKKAAPRYQERYGLIPQFKVGLHTGVVTTGEIGVIKKDIVYSGDVMNTTSRIQAVCNKFRVNILISKRLLDKLLLPVHMYPLKRVGIIELKGKRRKVELYTFEHAISAMEKNTHFAFT